MRIIRKLLGDKRGATTIEYALIISLIFLAMISAVQSFTAGLGGMWTYVADEVLKN